MPEDQSSNDNVLERTAKKLGAAAGKVANLAGGEAAPAATTWTGKLPKLNKTRLPRRMKKAERKAAAKKQ
jgi:hypothetical protein